MIKRPSKGERERERELVRLPLKHRVRRGISEVHDCREGEGSVARRKNKGVSATQGRIQVLAN